MLKFYQTTKLMILHEKYNQQLINVVIHVTQVLKKLIFQNLFVHLKVGFNNATYDASKLRLTF